MEQASPGFVKSYLQEATKHVERSIADHLNDDEEWLNQK
jgi:hypothetical protein